MYPLSFILSIILFSLFLFVVISSSIFKRKGFNTTVDYSEYHLPENLDAVQLAYLIDGEFQPSDFYIGLIQLYRKGYIEIRPATSSIWTRTSFHVHKKKIQPDELSYIEDFVYKKYSLFDSSKLTLNYNHRDIGVQKFNTRIKQELYESGYLKKKKIFKKNVSFFIGLMIFALSVLLVFQFSASDILQNVDAMEPLVYLFFIAFSILFSLHLNYSKQGLELRRHLRGYKKFLQKVELPRIKEIIKNTTDFQKRFDAIDKIAAIENLIALRVITLADILK